MNVYAVRAIYRFEMARTFRTLMQSIASPVLSTSLYFVVFGAAIGKRMGAIDSVSYGAFIVPGLMMLSILSDRMMMVPELKGDGRTLYAAQGFNVIATANTRDRGVNEMSAALKRRFNFVTVPVVEDLEQEIRIVTKREQELRGDYQVGVEPPAELAKLLVTMFQELRAGVTKDGKTKIKQPGSVLSTAEAISVLFNSSILAQQFGAGKVTPDDVARSLVGALTKDGAEDLSDMQEDEADRLDTAWGLTAQSRLGCQAVISGDVICELPMYTRNYVQEGGGIQLGKSDKKEAAR